MTEQDLQKKVVAKFSTISNITVMIEKSIVLDGSRVIKPDIVVCYGDKPFAIIEFKANEIRLTKQSVIDYFDTLTRIYQTFKCYIANIDDHYLYYNIETSEITDHLSFENALEKLENAINEGDGAAEFVDALKIEVEKKYVSNSFNNIFLKHVRTETINKHGNFLFLDRDVEIEMMQELLNSVSNLDNDTKLCRYMTADGFFYTLLNNCVRMKSTDAMNDTLETKVIEKYENLKDVKTFLSEFVYSGFILSFSIIEKEDKLFNWYMYGDRGKGVCITIKRKESKKQEDYFLFAPVVYIPLKSEDEKESTFTLLDYLNGLMSLKVPINCDNIFEFRLKLWHYWKYFFKYDFYKDEEEIRLLCITKKASSYSWQEEYGLPYTYIDRSFDSIPFEIVDCCVGPKYNENGLVDEVFPKMANNKINFKSSAIIGFRG